MPSMMRRKRRGLRGRAATPEEEEGRGRPGAGQRLYSSEPERPPCGGGGAGGARRPWREPCAPPSSRCIAGAQTRRRPGARRVLLRPLAPQGPAQASGAPGASLHSRALPPPPGEPPPAQAAAAATPRARPPPLPHSRTGTGARPRRGAAAAWRAQQDRARGGGGARSRGRERARSASPSRAAASQRTGRGPRRGGRSS